MGSRPNWLENDLAAARNAGKAIILNYHDSDQHWPDRYSASDFAARTEEFKRLLTTYNVGAVFCGHYHCSVGESPRGGNLSAYRDVPLFYCGSASQSIVSPIGEIL